MAIGSAQLQLAAMHARPHGWNAARRKDAACVLPFSYTETDEFVPYVVPSETKLVGSFRPQKRARTISTRKLYELAKKLGKKRRQRDLTKAKYRTFC